MSKVSVQSSGKAEHEWQHVTDWAPKQGEVVETKIDDTHGCRNETQLYRQANLWFIPDGSMYVYYTPTHWRSVAEQAAKPISSSAHFPRITKHDLEVVVEAMDKLREALATETEVTAEQPTMICEKHSDCEDCRTREAALRDEMRRNNRSWYEGIARHEQQVSELNTRDRELVEKLEGALNADGDWESREAALRAVLAARNEGGG